jgi:hypothetical protein
MGAGKGRQQKRELEQRAAAATADRRKNKDAHELRFNRRGGRQEAAPLFCTGQGG